MSAMIRLQLLVEGKTQVIADVNEIVAGVNASISGIATNAEKAVGAAAESITKNLQNIAAVAGVSFATFGVGAVTQIGSVHEAVRALNADVERLAASMTGVRFPSISPSVGSPGTSAAVGAVSNGPPTASSPISTASIEGAAAVIAKVAQLGLENAGQQRYVGTRPSGSRYDQPMVDDSGQRYLLRMLENVPESLRPTSNGMMSPETVQRTDEQIRELTSLLTQVAGPDELIRSNQRGTVFGRNYQDENGQLYQAQFRNQGDQEQFLSFSPARGRGGQIGGDQADSHVDAYSSQQKLDQAEAAEAERDFARLASNVERMQSAAIRIAQREADAAERAADRIASADERDGARDFAELDKVWERAQYGTAGSAGVMTRATAEDVQNYSSMRLANEVANGRSFTPVVASTIESDVSRYGGSGIRRDDAGDRADSILQSLGLDEGSFTKAESLQAKLDEAAAKALDREVEEMASALDELGRGELSAHARNPLGDNPASWGFGAPTGAQTQQAADAAAEAQRVAASKELTDANSRNTAQLEGFRIARSSLDGNGNVTGQSFLKPAGFFSNSESANVNPANGQMTRTVEEASSGWMKLKASMVGDGSAMSQSLNAAFLPLRGVGGILSGIERGWTSLGNTMIRVSAMFYSFERIGHMIEAAFLGPYERINQASEAAIKFRQSISETVGGMSNAGQVDDQMIALSRDLPLSLEQTRHVAEMITQVPALAPQLALATPGQSGAVVGQFADIATRIGISNPQAGQDEIIKAIGNALEGNLRGLRLVARINPDDLAQMSGMSLKQLQGNNGALLSAIQQTMRGRVSDETVKERSELPSVQWEKFVEQFEVGLQRIGLESGLFNTISSKFHDMMEELAVYVDSPEFHVRAKAIGDDLGRIFNNVLGAGGNFLTAVAGEGSGANPADRLMSQLQSIVHGIAGASDSLPGYATEIGAGLREIMQDIGDFAGFLKDVHAKNSGASNQGNGSDLYSGDMNIYGNGVLGRGATAAGTSILDWFTDKYHRLVPDGREQDRMENAASELNQLGVPARAVSNETNTSLESTDARNGPMSNLVQDIYRRLMDNEQLTAQGAISQIPDFQSKLSTARGGASSAQMSEIQKSIAAIDVNYDKLGISNVGSQYSAIFGGIDKGVSRLGGTDDDKRDKFDKTMRDAATAISSILAKSQVDPSLPAGNMFQNAQSWFSRQPGVDFYRRQQDGFRETQEGIYSGMGEPAESAYHVDPAAGLAGISDLQNKIDEIQQAIDRINGFSAQMAAAYKSLQEGSARFAAQAIEDTKTLDPLMRSDIIGTLMSGQSATQIRAYGATKGVDLSGIRDDQLMRTLTGALSQSEGLTSDQISGQLAQFGFAGMPAKARATVLQTDTNAGLAKISAMGAFNRTSRGNSLLFGEGTDSQQLDYLQGTQLPKANQLYSDASDKYAASGSDSDKEFMDEAAASVTNLQEKIVQLKLATNDAQKGFTEFGDSAQGSLTKGFGQAIDDLIMKTGNLKDVWKSLGKELVSSFSQTTSKTLMDGIFGAPDKNGQSGIGGALGGVTGGLLSIFSPGSTNTADAGATAIAKKSQGGLIGLLLGMFGGGAGGAGADTSFDSVGGDFGAANGGMIMNSWSPFAAFAAGGVVSRPTLGLVGERRDGTPEGVIPLLGRGRTIPLGMDSSGPHAILPGGRRIAASFGMAEGGVVFGGFDSLAFADGGVAGGGFSGFPKSGRGGGQGVVIYNVANMEEAVRRGYDKNRGHIINEVLGEARPGGRLRKVLNKST